MQPRAPDEAGAEVEAPVLANAADTADTADTADAPNTAHQDILRAVNFQAILVDALDINYNEAFSATTLEGPERLHSRDLLARAQGKLVELLKLFVSGNTVN